MKKHLQCLLMLAALMLPWAGRAQSLGDYTFSTGTDATLWVDMTSSTSILTSSGDGTASSVQTIGFTFPFGEGDYSQFSVNSDGNLRLGSTVTGTGNYSTPFSSSTANTNNPKINAFGCDGYLVSGTHYVKKKLFGDSLLVVEFCMGTYTSSTRNFTYKWQIHLHSNGNVEIVFPASSDMPATNPAVSHQCGMCVGSTDGWIISSSSNTATYFTAGSSTTNSSGTWFSGNRYYRFTRPVITCPAVFNLTSSNIDTASFDISWSDTSATEWLVRTGATAMPVSVTATSHTFTGLTPGTAYSIGVAPICTGDDTGAWRTIEVTTPCSYLTEFPYSYGFEGLSTGSSSARPSIPCWYHLNNGGQYYGYPYVSSTAYNGTRSLYWYATTTTGTYGDYEVVVLPGIDTTVIPISNLILSFWSKSTNTSYNPVFQIGVMDNPNDINTFHLYQTVNVSNSTAWDLYEISMADYAGTGRFIAVRANRPTSSWYAYTDDFRLDQRTSCEHPTDLTVSGVSHEEFTVSWSGDAVNTSGYLVRLDTVGGTYDEQVVYDTTMTYSMLDANRQYTIYVYGLCNMGDTTSVITTTVTTMCAPIDSIPMVYDFENASTGSSTSAVFAPCLVRLNNGTTYFGYPYVGGSSYNHTPGGSKGLYWYNTTTTGTYGDYQYVVLPAVDENIYSISALEVLFWAKASSTSYSPVFEVGVMDDPYDVSTFTHVSTINVGNSTQWAEYSAAFANYTGYGKHVAIRALRNTATWYAYFDDITLREAPACPDILTIEATTVATTGARLEWTVRPGLAGTAEEFELEIIPDDPNESTTSLTSTEPRLLVSGLTPGSTYHVIIRSNCMADGYSPWSDTSTSPQPPSVAKCPTPPRPPRSPSTQARPAPTTTCLSIITTTTPTPSS